MMLLGAVIEALQKGDTVYIRRFGSAYRCPTPS